MTGRYGRSVEDCSSSGIVTGRSAALAMSHGAWRVADGWGVRGSLRVRAGLLGGFVAVMVAAGAIGLGSDGAAAELGTTAVEDLLPVAALLLGVRLYRPRRPAPWRLFAAGQACVAVGDLIYDYDSYVRGVEPGLPSAADGWYLAMYPLIATGMLAVVRRRVPGRDLAALLDALLITIALGLLTWAFLIERYLGTADLSPLAQLTSAGYPLMDVLLLAVLSRLLFDRGPRPPSFYLLAGGMLPLLLSDIVFAAGRTTSTFEPGGIVDSGWVVYYACLGAAALHPSMARLNEPVPGGAPRLRGIRFGVLTSVPALSTTLVIAFTDVLDDPAGPPVVIATSVLLWAMALGRANGLLRQLRRTTALNEDLHRRETDERFQRLIENSSDVITVVDTDLTVRYQTPSVRRVLGYEPDDLLGTNLIALIHPDDLPVATGSITAGGTRRLPASVVCRLLCRDGSYIHAETVASTVPTASPQYVLTTRDVTARRALEEQLRHQAFHDSLTGLANRALFVDRVRHALDRRSLADSPLAVLFLDLDNFRTVNDSLGHDAGDALLIAVAERLRLCLRSSDTPARLGGDEFAVLLEDLTDRAEAATVAARILAALRSPFPLAEQEITGWASVGVALVDLDAIPRPEDLLRDAEAAMFVAKSQGRGGHVVFTPTMHAAMVRRLALTAELRTSLVEGQFAVHYQPILSLSDGRITGVETLARWPHPTRGMIGPDEFIPLAEESGLIVPLGRWVLEQGCTEGARWHAAGLGPLTIGVNVSLRQIEDPAFTGEVAAILGASGLPPHLLTLEITESFLAEESDSVLERLRSLKRLGVRLALDDFGTGYSSLSRLRGFPIDILKIPKPFVDGIPHGADQSALARTITDLARTLRMDVVAEGIEHWEQWAELHRMACHYGQGYYFAKPMPAGEIDKLLRCGWRAGPLELAWPAQARPA
ncbi:MAG: hypothetical protein V7637_5544 [Mycobacteriales bacterium]